MYNVLDLRFADTDTQHGLGYFWGYGRLLWEQQAFDNQRAHRYEMIVLSWQTRDEMLTHLLAQQVDLRRAIMAARDDFVLVVLRGG